MTNEASHWVSVEQADLIAETLILRVDYWETVMKRLILSIALSIVQSSPSLYAQTPRIDSTLPSVKPEALQALSDDRARQQIMRESQAPYSGRCVCSYQTKDLQGRLCKGRHEVIKAGPRPICYPAEVTSQMVSDWRQRHP